MRLCLLTYDVPHLKTAEVFWGLHYREEFEIEFLLVPFKMRPQREVILQHRPFQFEGVAPRSLAEHYGIKVHEFERRGDALNADYFLICGANILEPEFSNSGKIINCHAGLIPFVRGLDSFKWAIYNRRPVGNTLHIINEETDSGNVLHHMPTPVFAEDTLASFALRHYRNEIWLLQNFDRFINGNGIVTKFEETEPKKRMPMAVEEELITRFEDYKHNFIDVAWNNS